jgi:hypothetical protein
MNAIHFRYLVGPGIRTSNADLIAAIREHKPDLVWFDKPVSFYPSTIKWIKRLGIQTVSYNQDNAFGPRKDIGWRLYLKSFRLFDLHCLFRDADVARFNQWGLPHIRVIFSFEPAHQFPPPANWSDADRDRELSFIGSPYEERPQFLRELAERYDLPLAISGPHWVNIYDKEFANKYVRSWTLEGADYRRGIWRSKINLAFISHLNEDEHAHKSIEIAGCQGFLLARRSEEHQSLFAEGSEAEFFSSTEECALKSTFYLNNPSSRLRIANAGYERAMTSGYDNDTQISRILAYLDGRTVR